MKVLALLLLISSTAGLAMDCSYQKENLKLFFYGSSNELAKIEFKGSDPDRYFRLSKVKEDGLEQEFSEFAIRPTAKSPLNMLGQTSSMIYLTRVKGGNHYKLKQGNKVLPLNCVKGL